MRIMKAIEMTAIMNGRLLKRHVIEHTLSLYVCNVERQRRLNSFRRPYLRVKNEKGMKIERKNEKSQKLGRV